MAQKLFVGRKTELSRLEALKSRVNSSLVVIRGRRRVGKSRLVEEFAAGLNYYKFTGLAPEKELTAEDQRKNFAHQLVSYFGITPPDASDWFHLLEALNKALPLKKQKVVVFFDEISWMAKGDPTFLPKIKNFWDSISLSHDNVIFVICGSISSWIEENILGSTGFYGRIHAVLSLNPLSITESLDLLQSKRFKGSEAEKLLILSLTGGIPWYIEQFDDSGTASMQIQKLSFSPDGIFVNEFERIFRDLFGKRVSTYEHIVKSLIDSSKTYQEISHKIGFGSGGTLSQYLSDLNTSGFIDIDETWQLKTGKASPSCRYRLKDNYLRFYLKFIQPNLQKIKKDRFSEHSILDLRGFYTLMGLQFETLILSNKDLVIQALGIKPSEIVYDNSFFQTKTLKKKGCQVDYLIQTELKALFVCEIKYSKNEITHKVIDEVEEKIQRLQVPRGYACIPVLIYFGELSEKLESSEYFYKMIDFKHFMKQ